MTPIISGIFDIVVGCAMLLIFLRFMVQFTGIERKEPQVTFLYQLTQVVDVFARIFPTVGGGRVSLSAVALLFLLRLIFIWGVLDIMKIDSQYIGFFNSTEYNMAMIDYLNRYFSPYMLFFVAGITLVLDFLRLSQLLIMASFVISWIVFFSDKLHPALALLGNLSEPIIAPFRKIIPPVGMFDLAPMIGFFLIILLETIIQTLGIYLIKL
ncbi:YggT family protein [Faucicola mancuniensis]|uniref:YggT family protein n=1 Tax=Faucicola mancuniensis TaxID=1309795 RepID=UPI0028E337BC|nr:YggT family protein [uncultured Moraxella sp.]